MRLNWNRTQYLFALNAAVAGDVIAKRAFAPIDALTRVDGLAAAGLDGIAAARTARLQALGRRLL